MFGAGIVSGTGNITTTANIAGNYFIGNANVQYTASTSPPASGNLIGAQWYDTSTSTLYEYQNDGTTLYWVDITGPVIGSTGAGGGGSSIFNGTSNVTVASSANTTVGVAGTTILTVASTGEYVTGIVSATGNITGSYFIGNGSLLTGTSIAIKEEGSNLTTTATSIDFVGGGVTATNVGNAVTVTIPTGTTRAQAMTMSILFGG